MQLMEIFNKPSLIIEVNFTKIEIISKKSIEKILSENI